MPVDRAKIRDVEADIKDRPRGTELIVVGDFNSNLEITGGWGQDE